MLLLVLRGLLRIAPEREGHGVAVASGVVADSTELAHATFEDLGDLGRGGTEPTAINDSGVIVGSINMGPTEPSSAFRRTAADGFENLGVLGQSWAAASGINGAGVIIGSYGNADRDGGFRLVPPD